MANIPAEILIAIVRHVHQQDKLQCILVSRYWKTAIESTVLFETLSISSVEGLKSIKSCVEREPSYGTQVKRLLFKVIPPSNFELAVLPRLFPNVVDVYVNPSIKLQANSFDPWRSRLERYFGDYFHDMNVILGSIEWSNLTTLELATYGDPNNTRAFLGPLVNTPAVKHLKLHDMIYNADIFNFIHDTLPELQSLVLAGASYPDENLPKNITPASSVTSFSMNGRFVPRTSSIKMILSYILQKYPNLSELSIENNLYSYNHDSITDFLCNEWDDLLTQLAPHLQKLHILFHSRQEYKYVLQALDRCNCRINSLPLKVDVDQQAVKQLVQSNQSKHLQSLKITNLGRTVYPSVSDMTKLTQLELHYDDRLMGTGVLFNDLLIMCGENLRSLKISNVKLLCSMDMALSSFPQINTLEFIKVRLSFRLGAFISTSFPQLHTLKIRNCLDLTRNFLHDEELSIVIPNMDLQYLQVIDIFEPGYCVSVETLSDGQKRLLTTKGGREVDFETIEESFGLRDSSIFAPPVSIDSEATSVLPILTIVCNSVKDIFLSNI